jgi:hypothetical protein
MGDRFYQQQRERTGFALGLPEYYRKRGRKMAWDDDKKAQTVEMYTEQEPTPETSMEIVKEIADEIGESPNGVRMILTKAGVYVKKTPSSGGSSSAKASTPRVSKQGAQDDLVASLTDAGQEIDMDIISKLTGKAAVYFNTIVGNINS